MPNKTIFYERSVLSDGLCFNTDTHFIMKNLKKIKKAVTLAACSAFSFALVNVYPSVSDNRAENPSAMTVAEMQEEINSNKSQISELQSQLDALKGDKDKEQQYQNVLSDQIAKIQDNIRLLNQELESINADITAAKTNIDSLDASIAAQQDEIDRNIEIFKQRLCDMYISGNDNLASVMVGTASFYDMISRVEMVNRIASYDEELINDILADIDSMEQSKKELQAEKLTLEMKMEEQKKRKEEKQQEVDSLNEKVAQTQAEIDRIAAEQQRIEGNKAELEALNDAFDSQIQEEIARQAAYAAEQARIAAQQAAAATQNNYSNASPSYVAVSPAASGFSWPAPGFCYISSPYGYRWGTIHRGIDVGDAGIHGGAARASMAGTVIYVNNSCVHDYPKNANCCGDGYGNYVVISHNGTYSTLYGHLASACVSVGQYVSQGQVIGYIGSTGWSTGAHLHFEVRVNGSAVDPLGYVSP